MKRALALLLLSSCASGPVRKVRVQQGIDMTRKQAGCFAYLPEQGELTLMDFETCALVVPQERRP